MSYTRYCKCHFHEGESEHWGLLDRKAFAHKGARPHYTPDALVLPEHLILELNFDWMKEKVWGATQYTLVIKGHDIEEIVFEIELYKGQEYDALLDCLRENVDFISINLLVGESNINA